MPPYRGKRALDLAVSVPVLLVSLPLQASIAALVRLRLGKPILFRQERPGLHGDPFTMVKFRSMLPVNTAQGLVDDASRMTSLGGFLRSTSLDELPTIWSIVKGDMSLVGPRPLLREYLPLYSRDQARRHDVRPGLTGLAQISGRNALSWEEKFTYDIEYVERQSLLLDLRILVRTVKSVLRRDGISATGEATMPVFIGTRNIENH
jgi:lipopolysaccharide/colanic/teichoic acid biosynthesis glycosyltransferase